MADLSLLLGSYPEGAEGEEAGALSVEHGHRWSEGDTALSSIDVSSAPLSSLLQNVAAEAELIAATVSLFQSLGLSSGDVGLKVCEDMNSAALTWLVR